MSKSKIFFYFCLSFIGGIIFASFFNLRFLFYPISFLLFSLLVLFVLLYSFLYSRKILIFVICFLIIFVSIFYYYQKFDFVSKKNTVKFFNDRKQKILIFGKIISNPERDLKQTRFVFKAEKVKVDSKILKVNGKILIKTHLYPHFKYGDELELYGTLKSPKNFSDFDYKNYLKTKDIYSVIFYPKIEIKNRNKGNFLLSILYFAKNKFEEGINFIIPEPESALLAGLLLGSRAKMPKNILDNFSSVGLTHIIALSGFNITIIIVALFVFLKFLKVRKRISFWFSVIFILFFVLMTGASASVVRAAIMGILALIAKKNSRLYRPRNAIIFAGVLMLILDPRVLKYDVGFQLSFLATLGLIYFSPLLKEKYFYWVTDFLNLKEIVSLTISAQLMVFPILIYNFEKIPLIGLLTNILILPFIPLIMALGFFSGIVGLLGFEFLKFTALPAYLGLFYVLKVSEIFSKIPLASLNIGKIYHGLFMIVFIFYYLLIVRFYFKNKNILNEKSIFAL